MEINSQQIEDIMEAIELQVGLDLRGHHRAILERNISSHIDERHLDVEAYISLCRADADECADLAKSIFVNHSSFFRNPVVYEILAQSVIPQLTNEKKEVRIWSAGCASGEEAYSIAILIQEELKSPKKRGCLPIIFATDIDKDSLKSAKKAFYRKERLKDTKLRFVESCFSSTDAGFHLCSDLKKMVNFSVDDLQSQEQKVPAESIYGSFDLILCRNVLIYFTPSKKKQILQKLYNALTKGGYLVLGDSEDLSSDIKARFKQISARNRIYQK